MRLDALDVNIVRLLRGDARLSYREIAERLGSTNPTVSARVKALEDIGLLRAYRAQVDHAILGGQSYIATITVQPSAAEATLGDLRTIAGVLSAHLLPGGRIVAHVHLRPPTNTLAHLHRALAQLPGLVAYDAAEVIASYEDTTLHDLPENVEVACHQCKGPIHGDAVKGRFGERTHVFCCRQCLGTFRERFQEHEHAAASPAKRRTGPNPARTGAHKHHH